MNTVVTPSRIQTEDERNRPLDARKFVDSDWTATGEPRAAVDFVGFETLWFNTGTLCNLSCHNCYIESSPTNDRLVYLSAAEVESYLVEIREQGWTVPEIGFTGGEPFLNREFTAMVRLALDYGHRVLVLTNAMRPMMTCAEELLELATEYGERLIIRVSLDHYSRAVHEAERKPRSWDSAIAGLQWLARNSFNVRVAGRVFTGEPEVIIRDGFARLFAAHDIGIDVSDPAALVLLPEMNETADVPEISESCWRKLDVAPSSVMCATSRMIVKRRGSNRPAVVPCTLIPCDNGFDMGETLGDAPSRVKLNHPHCARFCVLGGGTCSPPPGDQ